MSEIVEISLEELLKENPELRETDIEFLREWCQKEAHLPKICDNSLARFLKSNNYHIEFTKVNIDNYYTLRTHTPEFFSERDTLKNKDLRQMFDVVCIVPLQKSTKRGHNILLAKLIDTDASKFHFHDYVKYILLSIDLMIYRLGSANGFIMVFDVQDVTLGHAARVNPFMMKKYLHYIQEGLPVRFKEIHFIHVNSGMQAILNISRPLMKKETLENLHLHSSLKTIEKFLPIKALPNELGGKAGPLEELRHAQIKDLEKHRDWVLEEELRSRVDETKRPGKAKRAEDLFGVEGSFKKLDVF